MEQGYTYIDVKPTIPASNQTTAFIQNDVLFDWTEVRIPAGVGRLIGVSVLMRGMNGAAGRPPFDVYFSKSNTFSLGNPNSAVDMQPNNDLLGALSITSAQYMTGLNHMEVANMTTASRTTLPSIELTRNEHRIYIAGVAQTGFNFSTNVETTALEDMSDTTSNLGAGGVGLGSALDDGSGGSSLCLDKFAPGDVIHAEDDIILGEIASLTATTITFRYDGVKQYSNGGLVLYDTPVDIAAWRVQNGTGATDGDVTADFELYNIHPITLKLSFAYGA